MKAAAVLGAVFKQREKRTVEVLSSGLSEVDSILGGLPRGAITEVFGPASSGRTSFMISTMAQATTHDDICALIDMSGSFDPVSAAAAGVVLDRLLWICCGANLEHAFKATDLVLQGGGFGLVVLDIGDLPAKEARRIISSWWYRFRRVLETTPSVLLVLAQDSTVRSCASLALELKRERGVWGSFKQSINESLAERPKRGLPSSSILLNEMQFQIAKRRPLHAQELECQFSAMVAG